MHTRTCMLNFFRSVTNGNVVSSDADQDTLWSYDLITGLWTARAGTLSSIPSPSKNCVSVFVYIYCWISRVTYITCVRACVRACTRAYRTRVCVRACMHAHVWGWVYMCVHGAYAPVREAFVHMCDVCACKCGMSRSHVLVFV